METAMVLLVVLPAQVQQLYITIMVRAMAWGLVAVVLQVMGR